MEKSKFETLLFNFLRKPKQVRIFFLFQIYKTCKKTWFGDFTTWLRTKSRVNVADD